MSIDSCNSRPLEGYSCLLITIYLTQPKNYINLSTFQFLSETFVRRSWYLASHCVETWKNWVPSSSDELKVSDRDRNVKRLINCFGCVIRIVISIIFQRGGSVLWYSASCLLCSQSKDVSVFMSWLHRGRHSPGIRMLRWTVATVCGRDCFRALWGFERTTLGQTQVLWQGEMVPLSNFNMQVH